MNIPQNKNPLLVLGVFLYALLHLLSVLYFDNAAEFTLLPPATADELLVPKESMTVIADPDGAAWVMYAQEAESQGSWRTPRYTNADNFPYGRYVGWHSINTQWLRFLGHVRSWFSGEDILPSIARASAYSNAAYLLLFSLPVGYLAVRLWSLRGAFLYPIFIYLAYNPRMGLRAPDHHLLSVLVFLVFVLSLMLMARERKRLWWIVSGVMLGALFWISPLSAVIISIAVVVAFPLLIPAKSLPSLSEVMVMTGTTAVVIFIGYVYEFFPDFQNHLEVVHPLYGVCILIAGFIIHQWCRFYHSHFDLKALDMRLILYPGLVLVGVGLLVVSHLNEWYTPSNLFLKRWMQMIGESKALSLKGFFIDPTWMAIMVVLAILSVLQVAEDWGSKLRAVLLFSLGMMVVILVFCLSQQRVMDFLWVPVSIVLVMVSFIRKDRAPGTALTIVIGLLILSSFLSRISAANDCRRSGNMDALGGHTVRSYNLRIRAQELLEVSPDTKKSILTTSGWGIFLSYYTHKPIFGSFYWENFDGNLRSYHMLYRRKDPDTGEFPLIREFLSNSKVDEIVVGKNEIALYMSYSIFGEVGRIRDKENAFIGYLEDVKEEDLPDWLILKLDNDYMRVFEVVPLSEEELNEAMPSGA